MSNFGPSNYGPNAVELPDWADQRLADYCIAVGVPFSSVYLTSTYRDAYNQARIMIEQYTWDEMRALYPGPKGHAVVEAGAQAVLGQDHNMGALQSMVDAMGSVGFTSAHMDPSYATVDISPKEFPAALINAFVAYCKTKMRSGEVKEVFSPGTKDNAIHVAMIPPSNWVSRTASAAESLVDDSGDVSDDVDDPETYAGVSAKGWLAIGVGAVALWFIWD